MWCHQQLKVQMLKKHHRYNVVVQLKMEVVVRIQH